jgi:signal transduction histidine kinase
LEIDQIINEEVRQLTNTAKEKGIYLKIDKKKDAPSVWADETKIRQVIMNFIDNAIHYTTKGGVTVSYGKERGHFVFSVKDTGIGVPREQQKKLFEKFFRADNARHTRPDGTGLGLFLAKRVVEDHNGSIFFSSIEGQGSVFGFRLPMKKSEKIKASTLEPRPAVIPSATANVLKDEAEEKNPEDVLTEQRQVPIPMNEPEHVLKK